MSCFRIRQLNPGSGIVSVLTIRVLGRALEQDFFGREFKAAKCGHTSQLR